MRALVLAALALMAGCTRDAPREDLPRVPARADWAQWGAQAPGEVSAVDVDSHGHVFVLHRPGRPWAEPIRDQPIPAAVVSVFDAAGTRVAQWGDALTAMPHGLSIAADDSVWITDAGREQVLQFSHAGALLTTLGERGRAGADLAHFGRPTDAAPSAEALFVADGYTNSRILRLADPVTQWGEAGDDDADFAVPHSVAVQGRALIVADRENSRLKLYDTGGRLVRIMPTPGHPYAAKFLPDGRILSLEGRDAADREGAVLRLWSSAGQLLSAHDVAPGAGLTRGHDLAVGPDGTIYIADVAGHRVLTLTLGALRKE